MSVTRWDPWGEMLSLREAMNRLLEDSYVRPVGGSGATTGGNLALDVWQDSGKIEVSAALPGMKPEDVNITVQGDVLVIRGEHKQDAERKEGNYLMRERRSGAFYRAIQLPVAVDADKAVAEFRNGVLHLTLPKSEAAKPRQIRIGGGDTVNTQARLAEGEASNATEVPATPPSGDTEQNAPEV